MDNKNKKDFESWNRKKKLLHKNNRDVYFRRAEVWWCALGVNIGYEQDGKNENFERPILVLKKINRHLALVIPLTSKIKDHPYYYQYKFQEKVFSAMIFQIKVISTRRFLRKLGVIEKEEFERVLNAVIEFLKTK